MGQLGTPRKTCKLPSGTNIKAFWVEAVAMAFGLVRWLSVLSHKGDVPGPQFTAIVMGRIMLNHDMVGSKVSGNPKVRFCGELRTHFFSGDYIGHRNGNCEI
jgi:hypothetical protein